MKNARNELNDMATENAVGGVSWQFIEKEPVTSEVETSNPSIFSDIYLNQTNNFVPIRNQAE